MNQVGTFIQSEGDAWLERNRDRLGERDLVSGVIDCLGITPRRVLEIGCANGWRLVRLRDKYGCDVMGVEPSKRACAEARQAGVPVIQGSAMYLPPEGFDLVIYGFCLYLTDPYHWFRIVTEGDRVLSDHGHLIIHDFPVEPGRPFARRYEHHDGVLSYHVDFAQFWLAHPWYRMINATATTDSLVTVLHKSTVIIPVRP